MSKDKGFSRIALKVPVKIPITEEPAAVRLVSCYRGLMPKLRKNTYAMRYIAGQPAERILPPGSFASVSQAFAAGVPLSTDEKIRVLVWNIFKQQRAEWKSVLKSFGKDAHLVLLQEAQTTPEMVRFATTNYLAADQVPALVLPQHPSGVMTLASASGILLPLREREPILRLAKSALVTVYPLPDTRLLMVVNIHAVNFSLGVDVYSKQLLPIGDQIAHHSGPVIMAGDFNAWSRSRMNALYHFAREMSLREVRFPDDQRRRAFGRPLDFVFYRGLSVHDASVLVTSASDHNPLLVEFSPGKPD
jgi:endonuclease/exonuclease/phosphatase (EEP) superfamily protein YafD